MNNNPPPAFAADMYLTYLDRLRESGTTNMFDAGANLQSEFDLSRREANEILRYWMTSFAERHSL